MTVGGRPIGRWLGAALAVALALSAAGPAAASGKLVLGSKSFAPDGWGWGTVKPAALFDGGDPSGSVSRIRWRSWGGSTAVGFGLNPIFKPGGGYYRRPARIELRAEDVGRCGGRRAYRRLSVRVTSHPGGKLGPWRLWAGAASLCGPPG